MNPDLKIRSSRGQLGWFFFLLIVGLFVASMIDSTIQSVWQGSGHPKTDLADPGAIVVQKILQAIYTVVTFLLPALVYAYFVFRQEPFKQLGFRKTNNSFYLMAILILFLSLPFDGWLGQLNHAIPLPDWMIQNEKAADRVITAYLKTGSFGGILVNVALIAILPAICEEACFRGALQPILIRICKNPWAGIILTAMIFSAIHMQFQGFLPRMFLGILLGAVYWYSGSLWVSIFAHFFTNALQVVVVSYYPQFIKEDPTVPLTGALISMVLVAGALILLRWYSRESQSGAYAEEIP